VASREARESVLNAGFVRGYHHGKVFISKPTRTMLLISGRLQGLYIDLDANIK
jgi:hypothetical protein